MTAIGRLVALWVLLLPAAAAACPFCTALRPTLASQRETADVVLLAEVLETRERAARLGVHHVLRGKERIAGSEPLWVEIDTDLARGGLVLALGRSDRLPAADEDAAVRKPAADAVEIEAPQRGPSVEATSASDAAAALTWTLIRVNETSYAYAVRAPSLREPAAERLRWFARYLEHADPLIAEDAYFEFGHAPYDVVAQVADALPMERLRAWLVDERVPQERKGFYGLALGLAPTAEDRAANLALLREVIAAPADDFRSGFDGVLGGYLVGAGEAALELIEARFLADPAAAEGDTRHALSALRFYYEYGDQIPRARLCAAVRHLIVRPAFAAMAVTDLARWQDWEPLAEVVALYDGESLPQPATNRAVIGYLLSCPLPQAAVELEALRRRAPEAVAEAERYLLLLGPAR